MIKNLFIGLISVVCLSGCAHYGTTHRITDKVLNPDGTVHSVKTTIDRTGATAFLVKGDATKIRSTTKDGEYNRSLSIGAISGTPDDQAIQEIIAGLGTIAGQAARAAMGIPPSPADLLSTETAKSAIAAALRKVVSPTIK